MIGDPYTVLVLIGLIFLGLQLYVLVSIVKNKKGENYLLDRTKLYSIQLRIETLFSKIHTRED